MWNVADEVKNGSETGTSFKQALYFKDCGFNLHDTMIWEKDTFSFPDKTRYGNCFEYMFVFSKGKPKCVNKICDRKNKWQGCKIHGTSRGKDGETFSKSNSNKSVVKEYGERFNIWQFPSEKQNRTTHPAVFPIQLPLDHIKTWTNKNEIVLDVFCGSGTTALACLMSDRHYIGFEINPEYAEIAMSRVKEQEDKI